MKENTTEYVILGILRNQPKTGYDINKRAKTRLGQFWDINYSQIYPTLKELEKEKLVTKIVETNKRGQNRNVYTITKEGKNKLNDWVLKPAKPEKFKIELILKIAFGEQLSKDEIIKHIEEFRNRNAIQLDKAFCIEEEVKAQSNQNEPNYMLLSLDLGIKLHSTAIKWADTTIRNLRSC